MLLWTISSKTLSEDHQTGSFPSNLKDGINPSPFFGFTRSSTRSFCREELQESLGLRRSCSWQSSQRNSDSRGSSSRLSMWALRFEGYGTHHSKMTQLFCAERRPKLLITTVIVWERGNESQQNSICSRNIDDERGGTWKQLNLPGSTTITVHSSSISSTNKPLTKTTKREYWPPLFTTNHQLTSKDGS